MCCEIRAIKSVKQECVRYMLGMCCEIRAIISVEEECVRNVLSNMSSKECKARMC